MLHPDLALGLAKLKFRELWTEAERIRHIRLSRQTHEPVEVPPGLSHLLRLKAEKREAWAELQRLAARIESHPLWRTHLRMHPRTAQALSDSLALGGRLQRETSADDRLLGRDLERLRGECVHLARLWCSLEAMMPVAAGSAAQASSPALGR